MAIVSPLPGTTRDVLEVALDLGGYPVVLYDTAGLRETADVVEQEGIRRARHRLEDSDIRLYVMDATRPPVGADGSWSDGFLRDRCRADADAGCASDATTLFVLNKCDLLAHDDAALDRLRTMRMPDGSSPMRISCTTGAGLSDLVQRLEQLARRRFVRPHGWAMARPSRSRECLTRIRDSCEGDTAAEGALITRARHAQHLRDCVASLERYLGTRRGAPLRAFPWPGTVHT